MKKLLLIFLIGIGFNSVLKAQYPINASVVVMTGSTPTLEDLTDPVTGMMGILLLTDQNEPTYDIQLRVSISGEGVRLTTSQNYISPVISLVFGVPQTMAGTDFREYLDPYNLDFSGISRGAFIQNGGVLPEGIYSVCIEAYDANFPNEPAISHNACTSVNFELHDPPLLIQPNGLQPTYTPQQLLFTWTPQHFGTFPVEYDLQIWEKVEGLADNQIISTHAPLFQTTSPTISYFYGVANPALKAGQEYIYRVRVRSFDGQNLFANRGYSTIGYFTYGQKYVPEICDNGIDDDGDGYIDCADEDCGIFFCDGGHALGTGFSSCDLCRKVDYVSIGCVKGNATGIEYSIDGGKTFHTSNKIYDNNLSSGESYGLVIRNEAGCQDKFIHHVYFAPCEEEICDNGIDDDGDGQIDCEDADCGGVIITEVVGNPSDCPEGTNNGVIAINTSTDNIYFRYSVDNGNTFSTYNRFSNLAPGEYNILVKNNETGVVAVYANNPLVVGQTPCDAPIPEEEPETPQPNCAMPEDLALSSIDDTEFTVQWTPPAEDAGKQTVFGYKLQYRDVCGNNSLPQWQQYLPNNNSGWTTISLSATTTSYTIPFSPSPSIYEVRIQSICRMGGQDLPAGGAYAHFGTVSEWTAPITIAPPAINCSDAALACDAPTGLSSSLSLIDKLTVTGKIAAGDQSNEINVEVPLEQIRAIFNYWEPILEGEQYHLHFEGQLNWASIPFTIDAYFPAFYDFKTNIQWEAIDNAASYQLRYKRTDIESEWQNITDIVQNSYTITELLPILSNPTYDIEVMTICTDESGAIASSDWSSTATEDGLAPIECTTPSIPTVTVNETDNRLDVSWEEVPDAIVSGYKIRYRFPCGLPDGATTNGQLVTAEDGEIWYQSQVLGLETTFEIRPLHLDQDYEISVQTICGNILGLEVLSDWSDPVLVSPTGRSCREPVCGIPQNFSAQAIGTNIELEWQPPLEGTPVFYSIRYKNTNDSRWQNISTGTATKYTLSNVLEGSYAIQIQSVCEDRIPSEWSEEHTLDIINDPGGGDPPIDNPGGDDGGGNGDPCAFQMDELTTMIVNNQPNEIPIVPDDYCGSTVHGPIPIDFQCDNNLSTILVETFVEGDISLANIHWTYNAENYEQYYVYFTDDAGNIILQFETADIATLLCLTQSLDYPSPTVYDIQNQILNEMDMTNKCDKLDELLELFGEN